MMFHDSGTPFVDQRLNGAEWNKMKSDSASAPFGCLPLLTLADGTVIAQSGAIHRYVSRLTGYSGADSKEMAQSDMIYEQCNDVLSDIIKIRFPGKVPNRDEYAANFIAKTAPQFYSQLAAILNRNGGQFFVGKQATLADFAVFFILSEVTGIAPKAMDAFPALSKFVGRMQQRPKLANWLATRPPTNN